MFKSSADRETCCEVTDAVKISSLILITHVCAVVIYKRFEF